ncbi:MAG: PadR family transcriptional regulator [Nevskia sp.]|nr:PadR family transcriptional regulator [Nevskia sp.]
MRHRLEKLLQHGDHHFIGRHHHHGARGFGRFGGGFMDDGGAGGMRMGRKLGSGDLQLLVLALLAEKPRHGYEIIKALEEKSKGFYAPSPGMVYPALTYLEEIGYATIEADGARKRYHITAEGQTQLDDNRKLIDSMFEQLARVGEKMDRVRRAFSGDDNADAAAEEFDSSRGASREVLHARRELKNALHEVGDDSPQEQRRIAEILQHAADAIRSKRGRRS